ncbi:hypothetical protein QYE76_019434 [Lolium multiflorum]|uniref:Uncharacterized protein n=1 Tax=Lolium multiflorum TaxID=4521 RepID=A0AAD8R530_LOLMU|nr:hypothetical protein QYE76_019434 [Lolium multiflorum]
MPPKRKAPAKAAKPPPKPRNVVPKDKPATMSQEECDKEIERHSFITADRRRRRIAAIDAAKAAATAYGTRPVWETLPQLEDAVPTSPIRQCRRRCRRLFGGRRWRCSNKSRNQPAVL